MKIPLKVYICDDDTRVASEWRRDLERTVNESVYALQPIPQDKEIVESIRELLDRQLAARENATRTPKHCLFDLADILIIDFDLVHIDHNSVRHTGEGIARLCRAFSTCGYIVVLNQYKDVHFDLSLLGDLGSHADLNLHSDLLSYGGLWHEQPTGKAFRPWHWPILSVAATAFRKRQAKMLRQLDKAILPTLGFTESDVTKFSDTAFAFISQKAATPKNLMAVTFRQFVSESTDATDPKDGDALKNNKTACARLASARLAKWLERAVLAPQDLLVDVPHLVQRAPVFLRGTLKDIKVWNQTAVRPVRQLLKVPSRYWFTAEDWLLKPALWWGRIESDEKLREIRFGFDFNTAPDFVFCEDASRFYPLKEAKPFRSGFHNSFDGRYVKKWPALEYSPRRRFALPN